MTNDKFVIWSDGSFTSMGIQCDSHNSYTPGKIMVKDPVSVVFSTGEFKNEETGQYESRLNFEMIPYIFGALLSEGENIWEIDARHILHNNNISPALTKTYANTVMMTSSVKRSVNGDVDIKPIVQ